MAEDYSVKTSLRWHNVESVDIMNRIQQNATDFDHLGFWKLPQTFNPIHITPNGKYWSNGFQVVQDFDIANVSGMNDKVNAFKGFYRRWQKKTMSVRNDPDNDIFFIFKIQRQ